MNCSPTPFDPEEHQESLPPHPIELLPPAAGAEQQVFAVDHCNDRYVRMIEFFLGGPTHVQSSQDFNPQVPCHIGFCYGRSARDTVHCIYWPSMFYVSVEEVVNVIAFELGLRTAQNDATNMHGAVTRLLRPYREGDRYSQVFDSSDLLLTWMRDMGAVRTQRRQRVLKWTSIPWLELLQAVESLLPEHLRRQVRVPLVNHLELGALSVYSSSVGTALPADYEMFLAPPFAPALNVVDPRLLEYIPDAKPLGQSAEYGHVPLAASQPTRGRPASTVQNGERRHRCSICDCTFIRLEHLTRHMRSHSNERPYTCVICDQSFTRVDNLHQHERTMHGIESVIAPRRRQYR